MNDLAQRLGAILIPVWCANLLRGNEIAATGRNWRVCVCSVFCKKAMQERLASYGEGKFPDMVLAANDNLAQGAIEALVAAGAVTMPVITGQDNTEMAQDNIQNHKQAMTVDKDLTDMAYNTAMIVSSLISGSPVQASHFITVGTVDIPVFYSKATIKTIDNL